MRLVSEYTEEDANSFYESAGVRMDQHHVAHGRSVMRIYIYPLCRDVQRRFAQDSAPRWIRRGEA